MIVVAGLLVAADRLAAWGAGQLVADRLARAYQLGRAPQVQVQGVPFLTQWSSGRYQEVDVQLPNITTRAFATSSADVAGATIGEVDVQGVVPYAGIPLPPGLRVTPQGNQLQLSGSISAAGASVPISATVSVGVQNGRLQLTADRVNGAVGLRALAVTAELNQQLKGASVALQLPVGARLNAVSVTQGGLGVSASASQVQMPS